MRVEVLEGEAGKIVLPAGMTLEQAQSALTAEHDLRTYDERVVTITETIERFPFEAAYALKLAADELHGASIQFDKRLADGSVIPARLIGVPISPTETMQVPWGPFTLPDIEGDFETTQVAKNGMVVMQLVAKVKRRYKERVEQLVARTRVIADEKSIYRGKAIKVKFFNDKGELEVAPPEFMDLSGRFEPIFSEQVQHEVDVNLLFPIRHHARAARLKVPKKRGILFWGTYGSGKTLTAYMTAKVATEASFTFIYIKDASELPEALQLARLYAPAIVFGEDIDRVVFGDRTKDMDEVLNTVDGVDSKDANVITVLTTNNLELIHPAFLREGRTDAIIKIDEPDDGAIEKLVRTFAGDLLPATVNLRELRNELRGHTPAFIREVVERSKLELLTSELPDDALRISGQDLLIAFHHHSTERGDLDLRMNEVDKMLRIVREIENSGHRAVIARQQK